jgi:DNA repair protein RecO (recombination protein O)
MILKTRAIAIHSVKYSENSIIAYVYSESHGRLSIMVYKAFGKGKRTSNAVFFQPLNIIDIVFYKKENQSIAKLKEVSQGIITNTIPFDPVKRALALFIGEVIYRTVREEVANPAMFQFLSSSIQILDVIHSGVSNFHLVFLMQLTRHLGFFSGNQWSEATQIFDLKNGVFAHSEPLHPLFLDKSNSKLFNEIMQTSFENVETLKLNHTIRNSIINDLLSFYQVHLGTVADIKSLAVLTEVFKD